MLYAISLHLSIEREALIGMTASEVVTMAASNGDMVTEESAQAIIDCAKADKAKEEAELAKKADKKDVE